MDMRKGFDGLASLVQQRLGQDPFSGQLFVFRGRRGDLIKILAWDTQGLVLHAKRLERGPFHLATGERRGSGPDAGAVLDAAGGH